MFPFLMVLLKDAQSEAAYSRRYWVSPGSGRAWPGLLLHGLIYPGVQAVPYISVCMSNKVLRIVGSRR